MDVSDRELRLQRIYLEALPGRLEEIQQGFNNLFSTDVEEKALFTLYRMVHNLAGSSATYGFELIGDKAKEMEVWLESFVDTKTQLLVNDKLTFSAFMGDLKQLAKQSIHSDE